MTVDLDSLAEELRSFLWDSCGTDMGGSGLLLGALQGDYLPSGWLSNLAALDRTVLVTPRAGPFVPNMGIGALQVQPTFEIHYFARITDSAEPGRVLMPGLSQMTNLWQHPWDRWPRNFALAGLNIAWAVPVGFAILDDLTNRETPMAHGTLDVLVHADFY